MAVEIIEFDLPWKKADVIRVAYDPAIQEKVLGIATDGESKRGNYFPVKVHHRNFELELFFINWDDDSKEIHPQVIRGAQNIQTLHGRLRLSMKVVTGRTHRGKYTLTLKQAFLKSGITLHSNLFGATFESLNNTSGLDIEQSMLDFGAIDVGTKSYIFSDFGPKRNECCVVFGSKSYAVPIATFVFTRVIPIYKKKTVY
jgi:hypothetical protein